MLTGERFRLKIAALGIESNDSGQVAVQVPAGSVVTVGSGPRARMVEVLWAGRNLVMFLEDVQGRGEVVARACQP
jgi:hypothetical protein